VADRYRVRGGRIQTRLCEVNIVDHCNLRCRACAHLSPVLPTNSIDPRDLSKDLTELAASYHTRLLRILGGEPLLHPDILDVLTAARDSGIADRIEIATNGLLLPRQKPRFWESVDAVRISLYPGRSLKQHQLDKCIGQARQHGVVLRYRRYQAFQESYSEQGTDDPALVKKIYVTCNHVHRWRCHTVANGWFFKCAQSYMMPRGMSLGLQTAHRDGIRIDTAPDFRDRLLAYLTSPEPLSACRNCLGSAGRYIEHEQIRRDDFRPAQCRPTEDLVHPRLLGPTRVALARTESLLPRTVVEPAQHVLTSSETLIGIRRKVQGLTSSLFNG
jgi:organic radical activating enzyme